MRTLSTIVAGIACATSAAQVQFVSPTNFQAGVAQSCMLAWTAAPGAGTYKLRIGTGPGAGPQSKNVVSIVTTNTWAVVSLPLCNTLYCHVYGYTPYIAGSDLIFSTTSTPPDIALYPPLFTNDMAAAEWATAQVHYMRSCEGQSYTWSLLYADSTPAHKGHPYCSDMAVTLADLLTQMGTPFGGHPPRILQLAFRVGTSDTHTIVTCYDSDSGNWVLMDPLFGVTMHRADGSRATKEDVNAATVGKNWNAVTYVALCDDGFAFAHAYALDYPLVYLNVPAVNYDNGSYAFNVITNDATPYLSNGVPVRYKF